MKKIIIYILLFILTFTSIALLALPIIIDLIFTFIILYIFKKKIPSVLVFNFLIISMIFIINISFGKNEKYGYFFRGHEKYSTKNKDYQKNIDDIIFMPHGDIYHRDGGLNKKRELIKEPRKQIFITDSHGYRNDTKIEEAEIVLVGDSFIAGASTSHPYIPSSALSKILNIKVASLSYSGLDPADYEKIIIKHLPKIKKNAKIYVFYFEGNDFKIKSNNQNQSKNNEFKYLSLSKNKMRSGYERLERNKDKFLLKILSEKNYFLRNIRGKSHSIIRKFFYTINNIESSIKYYKIKNKHVGFFYNDNFSSNENYTSYIFKDKEVLKRVSGVFFIPIKLRLYSDYTNLLEDNNPKFQYLINEYLKLKIPVYDLSKKMKPLVQKYLSSNKYLYWRDDTHWNRYGIYESMKFVSSTFKNNP
tara:strand:- start:73 stop:1326 length:1254 start_codon:yes stop_codon:yes gene_type:complete